MRKALTLAVACLLTAACYHVTVETGLPAGSETITKEWAHAFVYGLVPPNTVETAAKCKSGVAKVETQISFVNGLVAVLTWSLYTPMQINVTCASSNRMSVVPRNFVKPASISEEGIRAALAQAILQAERSQQPSFIDMR